MSSVRLTTRNKIINIISAMSGQNSIKVTPQDPNWDKFTVTGTQAANQVSKHAIQFEFKWHNFENNPKYLGYIINHDGEVPGKSVISIKNADEALEFAAGYKLLAGLRSKQRIAQK